MMKPHERHAEVITDHGCSGGNSAAESEGDPITVINAITCDYVAMSSQKAALKSEGEGLTRMDRLIAVGPHPTIAEIQHVQIADPSELLGVETKTRRLAVMRPAVITPLIVDGGISLRGNALVISDQVGP